MHAALQVHTQPFLIMRDNDESSISIATSLCVRTGKREEVRPQREQLGVISAQSNVNGAVASSTAGSHRCGDVPWEVGNAAPSCRLSAGLLVTPAAGAGQKGVMELMSSTGEGWERKAFISSVCSSLHL
jgi:hypothetical protein